MILKYIIKYLIAEQCLEVAFERLFSNFVIPDDRTKVIVQEIYRIYREVKLREGINIGSFEDFYGEITRIYQSSSTEIEMIQFLLSQLKFLQEKYPEI